MLRHSESEREAEVINQQARSRIIGMELVVEFGGQQKSVSVALDANLFQLKTAITAGFPELPVDRQRLLFAGHLIGPDGALTAQAVMTGSAIKVDTYPCYNLVWTSPDFSATLFAGHAGSAAVTTPPAVPAESKNAQSLMVPPAHAFSLVPSFSNITAGAEPRQFAVEEPLAEGFDLCSDTGAVSCRSGVLKSGQCVPLRLAACLANGTTIPVRLDLLVTDVVIQSLEFNSSSWNLELVPTLAKASFELDQEPSMGLGFEKESGKFRYSGEGACCARLQSTCCCKCLPWLLTYSIE